MGSHHFHLSSPKSPPEISMKILCICLHYKCRVNLNLAVSGTVYTILEILPCISLPKQSVIASLFLHAVL
jgi:hypothetical protein